MVMGARGKKGKRAAVEGGGEEEARKKRKLKSKELKDARAGHRG